MDEMAFEPIEEKRNRNYKCNVCGKYFYRKCHINRHMIVHAGQDRYSCKLCTMQFALQSDLHKHMFLHSRDTEYECDICGKKFSQSGVLSRHKAVHYEEKNCFECKVCFKQYTHKGSLMTHLMVHDSKVRYGCGECRREFTDKESFLIHVQGKECMIVFQQPKVNDVSVASVTQKCKLNEHTVMLGNTKLHECKLCFKQFSYRTSLYRHLHVQHPEVDCGCRNCEKRFSDEKIGRIDKDGIEHIEICSETQGVVDEGVNSEKEFGCSACCKQFKSKESFVMHVQTQECTELFKEDEMEDVGPLASVSGCVSEELKKFTTTSDNGIGSGDRLTTIKEEVICKEDFVEESYNRIEIKEEI